jgi:hypothetical protein
MCSPVSHRDAGLVLSYAVSALFVLAARNSSMGYAQQATLNRRLSLSSMVARYALWLLTQHTVDKAK